MILNIRGCSGSGKTYLVHQIMEALDAQPIPGEDGKIEGYLLKGNIRLVGPYSVGCGGCDRLGITKAHVAALREICEGKRESLEASMWDSLSAQLGEKDAQKLFAKAKNGRKPGGAWGSVARADILVRKYAEQGHVIFEGLIVSNVFGRWAKVAEDCGDFIWAFMDTPLEVCRQRTAGRSKKSEFKEADHLKRLYDCSRGIIKKAEAAGQRAIWLDHRRAFEQVMEILEGRLPPAAAPSPSRWNSSRLSPF